MSDAHESHWCYRCVKHVAVITLDDVVLCCECNNGFVSLIQALPAAHSTLFEVQLDGRRERQIERMMAHYSSRYEASLPNTLERDDGNIGGRIGAPPAAKSAVEALETFEVGSTSSEEGEMMNLVCAVCKDAIVMGEIGKKLPCGHCYHETCILPWLETRNSCPVCRFQLRTDDPRYERKRAREEPPLTVFAGASSSSSSISGREEPPLTVFAGASSSISGREENNNHHVVGSRRRSARKRKPTIRFTG